VISDCCRTDDRAGTHLGEPADNWWNLRVDNAPLDPNSAAMIETIKTYESSGGRSGMHPDHA
jgi:hypothetical protein